jgi:phosphatidate cytidylyltransferase
MNNFWTRTLTGAVFVVVMIGGILWNFWSFIGLFFLISMLGLWEFYSLIEHKWKKPQKIIGIILFLSLISTSCIKYIYLIPDIFLHHEFLIFILVFPAYLIVKLFQKEKPFHITFTTLFGIFYVILPFCYLILSYSNQSYWGNSNNTKIILGYFLLIWSNDTFAYLVGISIGKHRLFERISPKKSWEGFIGGIVLTQGVAYTLSLYFTELALIHWLAIALIVSVFGTLGDLVESMFKRSLGVKDSGNILPGHGGILDRFDGVLLSSPFVVTYLMMIR